jgi:hypothetical protein
MTSLDKAIAIVLDLFDLQAEMMLSDRIGEKSVGNEMDFHFIVTNREPDQTSSCESWRARFLL